MDADKEALSVDEAALAAHERHGSRGVLLWDAAATANRRWRICRAFSGRPRWPLEQYPPDSAHEDIHDED